MPRTVRARLAALLLLPALAGAARDATGDGAEEWTRFRGPNGSGVIAARGLPSTFGPGSRVAWRTEVPFGRSSPVVGRTRIFLTGMEDGKLVVVALDRADGRVAWRRDLERDHAAELYRATDSSTPTPVTDGENVYAFFHEGGLVSFDGAGRERWRRPLGPFRNYYGIAASPILAGDRLLVLAEQSRGSFLLALDKDTGAELWRRERPERLEAYTTPILLADGSVLVSGSRWLDAYDPATGELRWQLGGLGTGPISSPVADGERLYTAYTQHASEAPPTFAQLAEKHDADGDGELAPEELEGSWIRNHHAWVNVDGKGGISAADWAAHVRETVNDAWGLYAVRLPGAEGPAKIEWNYRRNVPYVPSPLVHDGVLYTVHEGILTSLDPATGKVLKRGRLTDGSPPVYASPIAADGKLFVATRDGVVAVVAPGGEWQVTQRNDLGEEIYATPAVADGRLLVRTRTSLYAFAAPPADDRDPDPGR